jgi:hypothetical protein
VAGGVGGPTTDTLRPVVEEFTLGWDGGKAQCILCLLGLARASCWPHSAPLTPAVCCHPIIAPSSYRLLCPPCAVEAGDVTLGKPADFPSYGWDNEYGSRSFHVRPFRASRFLVSNAEFLAFVRDGGYHSTAWWSEEGWRWRTFRNAKWPAFWVPEGPQGLHRYRLRLVFEVVDMPPCLPAVVNHHEARAYANWLSAKQVRLGPLSWGRGRGPGGPGGDRTRVQKEVGKLHRMGGSEIITYCCLPLTLQLCRLSSTGPAR